MKTPRVSILISILLLLLLSLSALPVDGQSASPQGVLRGQVLSRPDSLPVRDALVSITPAGAATVDPPPADEGWTEIRTDSRGRFSVTLAPGQYDVVVTAFGFEEGRQSYVRVRPGGTTEITVAIESEPFRLDEIVVMPSTYGMLREHMVSGQVLTREELEVQPHFGNDIFRAVAQVPGVSTYDFTSAPMVRGSRVEEVLTVLDGLELYEPYHLKQWDGSLSIVDVETVADVNLTTGGFTAEYGDASAGVFSMRTLAPAHDGMRTTVGLDFLSSMLKNQGTFKEGKGAWLVSARRGFLDLVFEITGLNDEEDLHPSYYDVLSKVEYEVRPGHRLSAHLLHAGDDNHGVEGDSTVYEHRYGSSYGWIRWEADLTRALSAQTVVSVGRVSRDRDGADYWNPADPPAVVVKDEATFDFFGLRQDWQLRSWSRIMLKWGFDARWGTSDYDYYRWRKYWVPNSTDPIAPDWMLHHDILDVATSRSGNEIGAYAATRLQPADRLTVEVGLRYDRQSHSDENQVAPRVNAALQIAPRTTLRGAWGHFHQSHGLHQLWVADGDSTFYPAQGAEHRVLGLEHRLENGISLRVEAYQRLLSDPLPEYRNLENIMEGLREEGPGDRVFIRPERGRARGVEVLARGRAGSRFAWSAGYALSEVEECIDGRWAPRPFDQRHAATLQVGYRPTPEWAVSAAWIYHSAWPGTHQSFSVDYTVRGSGYITGEFGPINQERLTTYNRVDLRASRSIRTSWGDALLYVDVFNLLNRQNAMASEYGAFLYDGRLYTERTMDPQLEMMPSVGVRWVF